MEKEMSKKSSSKSGKIGDYIFRATMYFLYGKRAGETAMEKIARLGVTIIIFIALIMVFLTLKRTLFP